jgi:hypothetical protein
MKCHYCRKEILGEEPFFFENEAYHLSELCLLKAIRLSRRNARREREEREQQKLLRWDF